MGKSPKSFLTCKICKSTFPSFKNNSNVALSHRSHRSKNAACRKVQERLKREHSASGNFDELNFDYIEDDEVMDYEDGTNIDDCEERKDDDDQDQDSADDDDEQHEEEEEEEEEEDNDDDDDDDDNDQHSAEVDVDTGIDEGVYGTARRQEDREYDEKEELNEEREEQIEMIQLDYTGFEEILSPREKSYWTNPQRQLIGVRVKKDFGLHGVFCGEIVGFQKPYYQVLYSDDDKEEYRLTDVLKLIDLDYFNGDHEDGEEEEEEEGGGIQASSGDERGNVVVREAEDDEPEEQEEQVVTILAREECEDNDILKLQEIMLSKLYDQRNSSSRFNKVNNGKDVDKLAALKILQYIEEHHLSVVEANEYLQYNHELIEHVTGKPFNMVKSYKTLKRVFLLELDKLIPLCEVTIDLPHEFFHDIMGKNNRHLPSLKAVHIPLEAAIAILLLKMSPDDLVSEMKPQYWRGTIEEEESVERLYTNWCSGKYACDIQRFVRSCLVGYKAYSFGLVYIHLCRWRNNE